MLRQRTKAKKGFSGRDSSQFFEEFISSHRDESRLITMNDVVRFFVRKTGENSQGSSVPKNFISSLVKLYNYSVLSEMKNALYFYNSKQIKEDILHYLCAINFDVGEKITCELTGKPIEVTIELLIRMGSLITGESLSDVEALKTAEDIQKKYTGIIALGQHQSITKTDLYKELSEAYARNLKEGALKPFLENKSFRDAVKSFGTNEFKTFDTRLRTHITHMIRELVNKCGYTEQGAKEICRYALDRKLSAKFS